MKLIFETELGFLTLTEENGALTKLSFSRAEGENSESPLLCEARRQIREYLSGQRKAFELPLAPAGTAFQRRCFDALRAIPYGTAISYAGEALVIGRPGACRAVGSANGKNPLPILIPCHRVLRSGGKLGGYSAGLEIKRKLLALEGIPYTE